MARMIGNLRVSTTDQAENGYGLDAQRHAIEAEAERQGWDIDWVEDARSGSNTRRAGLEYALDRLQTGAAQGIVVAKLDRLSRSMVDFAQLVEQAQREGWRLVVLDLGLDPSTPGGRMVAHVLSALSHWEREMIGQRTREGLAVARAKGVRLGRRPGGTTRGAASRMAPDVQARIARERSEGRSYRAIANALNADAVPTALGGARWHPTTVRGVVERLQRTRSPFRILSIPQPIENGNVNGNRCVEDEQGQPREGSARALDLV